MRKGRDDRRLGGRNTKASLKLVRRRVEEESKKKIRQTEIKCGRRRFSLFCFFGAKMMWKREGILGFFVLL